MADVQSNIHVNIDTSDALASLKLLQRQISAFHTQMAKSGTAAAAVSANQAQNLMNAINATGKFQASMRQVTTSTEHFTDALERNKLTSREYFRYTGAATKTFGRLFRSEFETLNKVARERVKDIQTQYIKMGRGANGALQSIAVRPLTLDMKNLGTQTAIAAQRQQLLNQLLKQGSTNLLNFGKNTQWAGRQLMVGFTVPLAMLGTTASKTFMKLEEQAIRFKRVYGELFTTQEETDQMVKQIQLLAKEYTKYGVAVEDTMKMAADAAAMGKMGADLTAQVAQATRLAVLGGVEQTQALETTISVTNAFGVATEDLAKKIDFLNAVENQTVVSIEDLTIAMPKAGPVVQQLGGDVEDLAFFLTAMKEGGINASEGANALKSGLASLINPSEKASKMLAGLGVNIKGIVEANKGDVKSTVIDFANALDTLDPLNRARAIEQLFGKFQFSRLSTLFQNVIGEGTQAARVLKLTNATTEELAILSERELNRIQNTTTYKFKKSMEDLKVALAPVGEQFLKALTPIVEFVGKVLDKFNNLGDGSKKFLTILTVAVAGVGPILLMTFGLIANAVANIIKLFASMKSMYNKTGSASKILGEQTNYLTKEQLEASAVAASLDQVHQKLNQTFTSEASAVNALANAYRRAIAAQAGFTGPVSGGKKMPSPKKFSTGTTDVPGTGNKDTVFSMLTPGEAVIPQKAAQDPNNRPVISAMIAGRKIQAYNTGTGDAQEGKSKSTRMAGETQKFHVGAKNKMHIDDIINNTPMSEQKIQTLRLYKDILTMQGIDPRILVQDALLYDFKSAYNQAMSKDGGGITLKQWQDEWLKRGPEKWRPSGINAFDAKTIDSLIFDTISNANPKPTLVNDDLVKRTLFETIPQNHPKVASSSTFNLMRQLHSNVASFSIQEGFGGKDPESTRKILERAKELGIIKGYEFDPGKTPDKRRIVLIDHDGNKSSPFRGPTGDRLSTTATTFSAFREAAYGEREKRLKELDKDVKASPLKKSEPEKYGQQISTTSGRSFTALKGLGGVYETADGRKVFVKPANSYKEALAEQRATTIARNVHGLDAPDQTIKTILDPTDPQGKRRIVVLESPFDPRFDPEKMSNTFTKEEYIRQNVAAALRADKDLGRGNLSGNILADVGPAGVFDRASGVRDFAFGVDEKGKRIVNLPSMEEQARINLGIDTPLPGGGRKRFFSEETANLVRSMTPDEYHTAMRNEINAAIPKLEKVIESFGLTNPKEKKVYQAMLDRLKEGAKVDWRAIHKLHSSIGIKPDEMIENEKTGKQRKPRTKKMPSGAQSSAGSKDTRITDKPKKGERVVQGPKVKGKATIPGFANAPESQSSMGAAIVDGARGSIAEARSVGSTIGTTLSQSAAAASRTALYGAGPIDAEAKSVRRRLQKIQREEAKTQAKIASSRTKLYGTGPIDADAKSLRRQEARRSKIINSSAFRRKIIAERAIANAQLPVQGPALPSGNMSPTRTDKLKLKVNKARYDRKQARLSGARNPAMGMAGAMGVASGVAMIGSMAPGKVGELSQKIMMPLMGMAMIMPMLQNKFSALAVGVGLVVAAYAYQRMVFDKAQDAALKLTEAMGSGTEAIKSLSEFSTKVGAGEIMDRRRKDAFSPFQIKTGKTTFGESYMAGEGGKAMAKNVSETIKTGGENGKGIAKDQIANQLMTAVISGVLDPAQARSIAANLGKQLGDYSFGIEVNSKLISMLGPNGENVLKDGVELEVKLLQDTRTRMNLATTAAQNAGGYTRGDIGKTAGFSVAGGLVGSGAGAIAGGALAGGLTAAGIGASMGSVVPVVGTIIGAALGVGVGAFLARKDRNKRIGEASGASIAMQKIALQQQQELTDAVELQYQKELEIAKAAGDTEKIKRLTKQYEKDQVDLLAENGKLVADIQKSYTDSEGATQNALMTGADKAITKQYAGTALEDVATLAKSTIDTSGIAKEQQYTLKMQMASGQIDPMQMLEIFETFGKDKKSLESVINITGKFGGAFANEMMGIVGMFKDKKQSAKFVADISTKSPKAAKEQLELFQRISQSATVVDKDVLLNYYNTNPTAAQDLKDSLAKIDDLKGKVTLEIATTVLGAKEMELLRADQEYFDKLPPEQQKVYLQNVKVMFGMEGDPAMQLAYKNWLAEKGLDGKTPNAGKSFSDYVTSKTQQVTETSLDNSKTPLGSGVTGEGNKVQSSPLDDLVKKLRDVRKNQIKVTEGWSASRKALDSLFGGSKTIDVFSGIENDLRGLGGSEDFIELIVGMDPKEYEKRKKSLFKFDNKGNIIALKRDAKNIQEALASITMGDWNSSMEAESKAISNQTIAFDKLSKLGVPVANAYDIINDKTIAAAIANGTNEKTLKTLISKYKGLTAAQEKAAAVAGVKTDLDQFKKDRIQEDRIRNKYSSETAFALGKDENLRAMESAIAAQEARVKSLIAKGADRAQIMAAQTELSKLVTDFNDRLNQLKNTIGFMQDMFDEGFSNAMDAFDVQETALNIKFKLDTKSQDQIIKEAQDQIAAIQYKVDDKEAALQAIEDQEQKINDKYDERIEALDSIERANASISQQQRGQLTLAEALTSGDIAAAARAAQDMRAQQAADAVTKQKDAVEQSRQYELSNVRAYDPVTKTYRTRKELEEDIKKLQDEIFKIEEEKIEPAQEFIRLRQIQLDKDIEGLTVLGKTRDAWEAIKNQIDLAMINSAKFIESMQLALSTKDKLISAYNNQQASGNDPISNAAYTPEPVIPGETPEQKAAREAAAKAAADAAAKAAADKAAADAAAKAAADKAAAEAARIAAINANPNVPSYLASQESGAIGAASIASKQKAAAEAARAASAIQIIADRRAKYGYIAKGGLVPKYFAAGGFAKGTDTVPAMLTPGEFIMSKYAVDSYGVDNLRKINNGAEPGGAVYNNTYTLTVNAKTDANPNEIAQAVMSTIKQVDDRRIRGVGINGRR